MFIFIYIKFNDKYFYLFISFYFNRVAPSVVKILLFLGALHNIKYIIDIHKYSSGSHGDSDNDAGEVGEMEGE